MKAKLQQKLFQKYPALFKQRTLSLKESAMPRGIIIEGDGWYWLLDNLCECIQSHIDRNHLKQIEFVQVKEKMGWLCIYPNHFNNKTINTMLGFAAHLSRSICMRCGSTTDATRVRINGYRIIALCKVCRSKIRWEKLESTIE